eukprot:s1831_g4.t2
MNQSEVQAFVEQLLGGLRLTLSMDGVGLDVHAKLNKKCTCLELTFSNVLKRIFLKSIRSVVPVISTDAVRCLESLERPGKAAWATKIELEDDRVCEFIFDFQREAEYFGCSLKAMCQDARLQTARPFDDADLAAGLPTARSLASDDDIMDPEGFMDALYQALKENADSLASEGLHAL